MPLPSLENIRIAIIGVGYVGLPLAVAFGKSHFAPVIGYNRGVERLERLKQGHDPNEEISDEELRRTTIEWTNDSKKISEANFIIVTVPTPITKANTPDLEPVESASRLIGEHIRPGTVVVYESTVYPGLMEEVCVPLINTISGLVCGSDWFVGYSPERTNPGDTEHTLATTIKVVSGMDAATTELIANVYGEVCTAGIHRAPNIKTAEAEKVIENIQRDVNIAIINELAIVFHRMGINTKEVLDAAATKWNFHRYQPGLVGGHCIGVDPYYFTYKAIELGYHPQVILSGRRINDGMGEYVAQMMIQGLIEAGKVVQQCRVLVMGFTFKEDIRDIRNSKIRDTIDILKQYGITIVGHDPKLTEQEIQSFGVEPLHELPQQEQFDGIIVATLHAPYQTLPLSTFCAILGVPQRSGVLVDIKSHWLNQAKIVPPLFRQSLLYRSL